MVSIRRAKCMGGRDPIFEMNAMPAVRDTVAMPRRAIICGMNADPGQAVPGLESSVPSLRVDYRAGPAADALADPRTLAVFSFGTDRQPGPDARELVVPLASLGPELVEVWQVPGPVSHGRDGDVRWATDGALLFGAIEVAEGSAGIVSAAEHAYTALHATLERHGFPHPLRIWNYLDAIIEGEGDLERYRQFCVGRARGFAAFDAAQQSAATAIGSRDGRRIVQVYWLAARVPGLPLDNPRQVTPKRYPRQYGPQAPSFARAMLPPTGSDMPLLLSGTASVVGHETRHKGDTLAQLDETFANLDSLLGEARRRRPSLPAQFGSGTRLKVYLPDTGARERVEASLARLAPGAPCLLLEGDVCRRDLHVEVDGVHS